MWCVRRLDENGFKTLAGRCALQPRSADGTNYAKLVECRVFGAVEMTDSGAKPSSECTIPKTHYEVFGRSGRCTADARQLERAVG